jgi:outer membrane autotransporter protein
LPTVEWLWDHRRLPRFGKNDRMGIQMASTWRAVLLLACVALFTKPAVADPPSFTGEEILASGPSTLVNLRGQGAIAGTAPVNVQINAVRVGGILSPLISIVRRVLEPGATASVCVEVQNLLGLDLTFLGVEVDVTAFNAEAPNGVSGRIVVQTGIGSEDTSPLACADDTVLAPRANAGPDQNLADSDQQPGENVTLDGSASLDPDGTIVSYQWLNASNQQIATGATPTVRLADGDHTITLLVTDDDGTTDVDTVVVRVTAPSANQLPIAVAGANRIVADSDGQPGESVVLNGAQSTDADGTVASYEWLVGRSTVIASGPNPTVRLADGPQTITLRVTDDLGGVGTATLTITVAAPNPSVAPFANAGPDRTVADTDALPGENVTLDASASTDSDGTIVSYQWFRGGQALASGVTATVRLDDGEIFLTLIVTDDAGNSASDAVLITVAAAPVVPILSALPGLTPNQLAVARALDSLCPRLSARGGQQELTEGEASLLTRCNAITFASTASEQVRALDEISPQDLNATRTQMLNLSRAQLSNIADRLTALRKGARGLSLTGLNLQIDGEAVPLAELAKSIDGMLGGGASADSIERDGLLDARLGLWLRGNYSFGSKEATVSDHGFDADQWGVIGGVDFRFSSRHVAGLAIGYGRSAVDFGRTDAGNLATNAVTAALYATMYSEGAFYVDAVANYLRSAHDSRRHIAYSEAGAPVEFIADGATNGTTLGAAVTFGYDLSRGGFSIAPSAGFNYFKTGVERFREHGAAGLDLAFEGQDYVTATANAGLRVTYAWRLDVGVLLPQIRGEYIRELMDGAETFGVRFANDPFDETPLIVVTSQVPDRSYWRIAGGFAAQFKRGISGFIEYQRLESLQHFDYADLAMGLRIETSFR